MPNMFCVGSLVVICVPAFAETCHGKAQIMIGQGHEGMPHKRPERDIYRAAANLANRDECGSLLLDSNGRIRGCDVAGERIFGARQARLVGRGISEFIEGLLFSGSSPSYSARYLTHLCAGGEWGKFKLIDIGGRRVGVELNLSRTRVDGREIFMLNLRRPEESRGASRHGEDNEDQE